MGRRASFLKTGASVRSCPPTRHIPTTTRMHSQRSTNLGVSPSFSSVKSNIVGQAGLTTSKDASVTGSGPFFYRVGVQ